MFSSTILRQSRTNLDGLGHHLGCCLEAVVWLEGLGVNKFQDSFKVGEYTICIYNIVTNELDTISNMYLHTPYIMYVPETSLGLGALPQDPINAA